MLKRKREEFQQTFSNFETDYILDQEKKELVEVGKINLQEKIQSNASCALDKILDKFLDINSINNMQHIEFSDEVIDAPLKQSNLDEVAYAKNQILDLKHKYGVDDSVSDSEVIKLLNNKLEELNKQIEQLNIMKGNENDEKIQVAKKEQ